jgi:hypothetical protein
MVRAGNSSITEPAAAQGHQAALPDTLPPLPRPQPGFYFHDRRSAFDRAAELNGNVLVVARTALAECYARIAKLRHELLNPLPGMSSAVNRPTAAVLTELLSGLIDADGNSVGFALGQCDEAQEWQDVPDADEAPLFSWAYDCAPLTTMRVGGV